ncbi:hypothetical protein JCM19302_2133 [Jejuia pallidilutea]|uniref:Uncharacterized protein n=1 Tax=Jejuia pallidilutea TaxID=504487 RepID=A0A090W5J7_9FLAO|nr:hypothetical protein JCM19302_2133 [Jejuia pallidilutea]
MSEPDNLQHADGKNEKIEVSETKNAPIENTVPQDDSSHNNAPEEERDTTEKKVSETQEDDGINEIEESNAEDAEDEGNKERHTIAFKEYDKMSLEALAIELEKLLKK